MTQTVETTEADRALKARHRAMWALGDYPALAHDVIADLGPRLVAATGVGAGDSVIDVGAGAGNAAIPASATGAEVTASDLTPELLEVGRSHAEDLGHSLAWVEADAEALPFEDGRFDAAMSCVGVMFAPHHQASADELVRVVRPGGTIGLLSWTPRGFIGQMFATMRPYAPAPPPGGQPPPLWGDEGHLRGLFDGRVVDMRSHRETLRVDRFRTPEELRDYFKARYGPTIVVYRALAAEPDRVAALDDDLVELVRRFDRGEGSVVLEWEYLLTTMRVAG